MTLRFGRSEWCRMEFYRYSSFKQIVIDSVQPPLNMKTVRAFLVLAMAFLTAACVDLTWQERVDKGRIAMQNRDYKAASELFESAIHQAMTRGVSGVRVAPVYLANAQAEIELGNLQEATFLLDGAIREAQKDGGKNSEQLIPIYKERWKLFYRQKKFVDAQREAKEALRLERNCCEPGSERLLDSLNLVIASACAQDRCADTGPYLEEQLQIRREHLGKEHPHVAVSLCLLGELAEKKQQWKEAEARYIEALAIRKKAEPQLVAQTEKNLTRVRANLK